MKKKILLTLAFILSFHFINAQAIDGTKILMHFPFDSDLADDSSVGVSLTPKTASIIDTYVTGKIGNAAYFNATPYITSGSTFDAGSTFTIAVWAKFNSVDVPSGTGTPKIIHQEDVGATTTFLAGRPLQLSGATRPVNTSFGEAAINSTTLPGEDSWVHIAVVMDKTAETLKMYINGVLEVDTTPGANIITNNKTNNGQLSFGVQKAATSAGLLDGYLDDFFITTEALSENQIKSVMTLGVEKSKTSDTNIWLGTSSDFGSGSNWSKGTTPVLAENVIISSGVSNNPTATSNISANNIVIEKNASLNAGSNSITATSTSVYGGGSLIAGSVSGTFTYNVITNIDNTAAPQLGGGVFNPAVWNLMSSPVVGETYDDTWILDNFIGTGTAANRAIALYDNSTDADGSWSYYQATTAAQTFNSGIGFSTRKKTVDYQNNNEEVYSFIGTYPNSDVTLSITANSGSGGNNWNLVGNPFPSYIRVSELIAANAANITDANETVYVWNPNTATYTGLSTSDYIAPGQGFFVNAANSNSNNFTISTSLQSHQTGVTFYKNTNTKIDLSLSNDTKTRTTYFSYGDNETFGLDRGKDIGMFTGASTSFGIYSNIADSSLTTPFERQALPNSNLENTIIPIGVIAEAGEQINFSANVQNLPSGLNVYVEDRENNTLHEVNDNSVYTLTLNTKQNGTGRFYLHTRSSSVLSSDFNLLERVSIYKLNNNTLRIAGLQEGNTNLKLYNILGRKVLNTSFSTKGNKDVSLPNLSTGVYIVKLEQEKGTLSKKIILE